MLLSKEVKADITKCGFYGNKADNGGAIDITTHVQVHIAESSFLGNGAEKSGGALSGVDSIGIRVHNSKFEDNNATLGAAINLEQNASINISNCQFYKNHAKLYAGAVMLYDQTRARIKNTQFEGNIARHGGVFYFEKYAKIEIELTELNQNIANFGSCIRMNDKSIARIQYSSFSDNKGTD